MPKKISFLLINPWITDFAAYNFWSEPLGLLYIAAVLRNAGATIHYIDCLRSVVRKNPGIKKNGCSKYLRTVISKPAALKFVDRNYARYGIDEEEFLDRAALIPRPDAVLVTSMMTYWYPGVVSSIQGVRKVYGHAIPIVLGGNYARLCPRHAETAGADLVYTDQTLSPLLSALEGMTGKKFGKNPAARSISDFPVPLHGLQSGQGFFCILTSTGCPFACSYCATPLLYRSRSARDIDSITEEITTATKTLNTRNVAFYDDALLADAEHHFIPLAEEIVHRTPKLTFHLPNGIHASFVTKKIAGLLKKIGVETIRIGLETADPVLQRKTGGKTSNEGYKKALSFLREAGFKRKQIGTYVLIGFPGQRPESVDKSIDFVYECGGSAHLSYFSPIPGTGVWEEARNAVPFDINREPLLHNNTVYILGNRNFTSEAIADLKMKTVELRQ